MMITVESSGGTSLCIEYKPDSIGNNYTIGIVAHGVFDFKFKAISLQLCGSALLSDGKETVLLGGLSDIRVVQRFIEDTQPTGEVYE